MDDKPVLVCYVKVHMAARRETWRCSSVHKCQKGGHDCPVENSQHLGVDNLTRIKLYAVRQNKQARETV